MLKIFLQTIQDKFLLNKVLLLIPPDKNAEHITEIAPFTKDYKMIDDKATAYICTNYRCQKPTTDVKTMLSLLGS